LLVDPPNLVPRELGRMKPPVWGFGMPLIGADNNKNTNWRVQFQRAVYLNSQHWLDRAKFRLPIEISYEHGCELDSNPERQRFTVQKPLCYQSE